MKLLFLGESISILFTFSEKPETLLHDKTLNVQSVMIFFIWNKYFLYLYLLYFKVEENADFSPIHPSTNPTENFYFHYSVLCYFHFP